MHPDAWNDRDRAVNMYKRNARFIEFFEREAKACANRTERTRVSKMLREMLDDFAGYQREDVANIIDRLEAWGVDKDDGED